MFGFNTFLDVTSQDQLFCSFLFDPRVSVMPSALSGHIGNLCSTSI